MTHSVPQSMAQRIARFTLPPATKELSGKVFNHICAVGNMPSQFGGSRDSNSLRADKPGNIHDKIRGLMSEKDYANFRNTLQNVGKGKPLPTLKRPGATTAPATLPKILPQSMSLDAGTISPPSFLSRPTLSQSMPELNTTGGAIPVPPPLPPQAWSQSMPTLNKSTGWGEVKGASLDDAAAEFTQYYTKTSAAKKPASADKKHDDMLSQLRDVLKKRISHK